MGDNRRYRDRLREISPPKPPRPKIVPDPIKTKEQVFRRKAFSRAITLIAREKPCADCGRSLPPWMMELDHPPTCEKMDNVSRLAGRCTNQTLIAEIHKCTVVCNDCHKRRTRQRNHMPILDIAEQIVMERRKELEAMLEGSSIVA